MVLKNLEIKMFLSLKYSKKEVILMRQYHILEPIYDENSKILILGSFPSVKSREKMMYYSHPQNRFWKVMSNLFDEIILDKKEFLLKHNIALWDVIESCDIEGSSDSSIKNIKVNDIKMIVDKSKVVNIFVLGKKAMSLYNKYVLSNLNMNAILLSSTSPANANKSLNDLILEYKIILEYLNK